MADLFQLSNLGVADVAANDGQGPGAGSSLKTGDLRRKYNFGDRVSELSVAQDPFFRFMSKVSKKPTDDPSFKFTERRPSWHKRYAYINAFGSGFATDPTGNNINAQDAQGDTCYFKFSGDWGSDGNKVNIYGQGGTDMALGDAGTQPKFFLENQLVRIPTAGSDGGAVSGYQIIRVTNVDTSTSGYAKVTGVVVKGVGTGQYYKADDLADLDGSQEALEAFRCYVVGTAHKEGSGYPETWKDQPFVNNYGVTQIWKTSMAMTNTARATVLKYDKNEWARVWKEKLIEHKWDIEQSLLFGQQYEDSTNGINYTQGAVDYITQYGNLFSLDTTTKTADDFLDDLSAYMDPRYAAQSPTVFFCNTAVYNWLHKLGGYFKNNLEVSPQFRADMAITGKKKVFGVDITTITTPYGDMNVARNIHLDGTDIKILGIGLKNCSWRPLVGNGVNRDTSVYVGVQTLENSGIDRRVDLILTEGGMEWSIPESHALWS